MPPKFHFKNDAPQRDRTFDFQCTLKSQRCDAKTKTGAQCRRHVVKGLPFCWYHLKKEYHLIIKASTVPEAGSGLFACRDPASTSPIVFLPRQIILPYVGQNLTSAELNARYGAPRDITAPYAVSEGNAIVDSACMRGSASFANDARTKRGNNANLKLVTLTDRQATQINGGRAAHRVRAGDKVFCLVAQSMIRDNDEIFTSYGRGYWRDHVSTHSTSGTKPKRKCG
jgi:hypothetical protein